MCLILLKHCIVLHNRIKKKNDLLILTISKQFIIYILSTREFQYQFSLSDVDDNADGDPSIQTEIYTCFIYGIGILTHIIYSTYTHEEKKTTTRKSYFIHPRKKCIKYMAM